MSVKIVEEKEIKPITAKELSVGDVYSHTTSGGSYYLKIQEVTHEGMNKNTIEIKTGRVFHTPHDSLVYVFKATLQIQQG